MFLVTTYFCLLLRKIFSYISISFCVIFIYSCILNPNAAPSI